jgi:hypothetical protein
VDLDDDARRHAREAAAEERSGGLECRLADDRVRLELPHQPSDPHRQREPERDPVERARAERRHEPERRVAFRGAGRCGCEHPELELTAERGELLLEARRERQAVPRPADEEDTWPAHA